MKRFFVVVLVLGFVFIGCAKKEEKKVGQYVIKIDNVTITSEDIEKKIETLPPFAQKMFEGEEGISKLLDNLINQKLLYLEAMKKGLDKDPGYIKNIEDSKEVLLIQFLLKKEFEDKVKVSDKEVKDFYEKNKENLIDKSGKPVDFDKVKSMLAQQMTAQKENEMFESYMENLKKSYKVDRNKEAIAALVKKHEPKSPVMEEPKKEESKEVEKKEEPAKKEPAKKKPAKK